MRLNERVKRNRERFLGSALRCREGRGGRKLRPPAKAQVLQGAAVCIHRAGVIWAVNVLVSAQAAQMGIYVVRGLRASTRGAGHQCRCGQRLAELEMRMGS